MSHVCICKSSHMHGGLTITVVHVLIRKFNEYMQQWFIDMNENWGNDVSLYACRAHQF